MNNKQSPLDTLVSTLTSALTKPQKVPKQKTKRNRSRQSKRSQPLTTPLPRDRALNLTGTQFTATTPLMLPVVKKGTTPGGCRVTGREMVSRVSTPVALTGQFSLSTQYASNTGNGTLNPISFPRLANYGFMYEYFIFHKITYIFQSNQPTTAAGTVILAVDYDSTDAAPTTSDIMLENISATMSNIYSDNSLQVLKSLSRLPKYECVNTFVATENLQQKQAVLYIAFEGVTATINTVLGYVIAEYDVEFFTPSSPHT